MFFTRLLSFVSICYCLNVAESVEVVSITSHEAVDSHETFQQVLQSSFDPGSSGFQTKVTDQVYGYPNASIGDIIVTGQTNDFAQSFFGIPYAEPPVGDLRFASRQLVLVYATGGKKFKNNISAFEPNRVKCIQPTTSKGQSEDCLVLNIHVPASVDGGLFTNQQFDQLLPVMFYIHGGKFSLGTGTSKSSDGRFLSNSTNTVVVTINYRLGALGFLAFEEDGVTFNGNQGLRDQQLALKWVHENIQNFGGDPDKITIFGGSAGAQAVMLHLASKLSKPYFRRCIMESNPAVYDYPTVDRAKEMSAALIGFLNCENNYNSNVECLRNIDPVAIVNQMAAVSQKALDEGDHRSYVEPFRPVVDGDEFPKQPLAMFQEGNWNKDVEVIMGTNREEMADINIMFYNNTLPYEVFEQFNQIILGDELAPKATAEYSKLVSSDTDTDYTPIIAQEYGDLYWICPSRLLARFISETSTSGNIYLYSWNFTSCDDPQERCYYACHTCEVSYVFNTRSYTGQKNGVEEQAITAMFNDFWGSFAYTGVPTSDSHDPWLKYEPLTEGNTVNWQNILMKYPRASMEVNYMQDLCDFWDSLDFYVDITSDNSPGNGSSKSSASLAVLFFLLSVVALSLTTAFENF